MRLLCFTSQTGERKKKKKQDAGECARNVFIALRALQQIFFFAFYSWSLRRYRGVGGVGREWNKEIESWMQPLAGDLGFVDIPAAYQLKKKKKKTLPYRARKCYTQAVNPD